MFSTVNHQLRRLCFPQLGLFLSCASKAGRSNQLSVPAFSYRPHHPLSSLEATKLSDCETQYPACVQYPAALQSDRGGFSPPIPSPSQLRDIRTVFSNAQPVNHLLALVVSQNICRSEWCTVVGLWATLRSTGLGLCGSNITCGGP